MRLIRWLVPLVLLAAGCSGASSRSARPGETAADSGAVTVGSATLHYTVAGSGTPCVVIGSRVYYPRTFSSRWQQQLRCYYVDHRGFTEGAQPEPGQPYGVPAIVADLEAVRAQLGLERFVLVGHSIHGLVALAYASRYPEHVSQVIAIGAPPEWSETFAGAARPFWEANASPGRKAQHDRNRVGLTPDSLAKLSPSQAFIATYVANAAQYWADSAYDASGLWAGVHVNATVIGELFDLARPYRLSGSPGSVSVPAYVALGREDFVVPHTSWDGARTPFANLTVKVFDRAGHTPQLEAAAEFDREVLGWLKG